MASETESRASHLKGISGVVVMVCVCVEGEGVKGRGDHHDLAFRKSL